MALTRIGTALVVAATALALPASAAAASEPGEPDSAHCALDVDTGQAACAADAEEARRLAGAADDVLLARLYPDTGFDGVAASMYGSHRCSADYEPEFGWPDLRDWNGWNYNNRVSSVRTYNRCDVKLHDRLDYRGPSSTWIDESSNLSNIGDGWNNRASSVDIS